LPKLFSSNRSGSSNSSDKKGLFRRLRSRLSKTRDAISTGIDQVFKGKNRIDGELLEDLEELLVTSDIGIDTTMELIQRIEEASGRITSSDELRGKLKQEIVSILSVESPGTAPVLGKKPHVIMVVGVNGVGKTTTIGKLAARKTAAGESVLISAADTFRAAAIEQLTIWSERAGATIIKHKQNTDPTAVVYDSIDASIARGIDTVIIDTAGRLHTKVNLMEELRKMRRIISKKIPEAPHEVLLVLDATTGQNAISQAKLFDDALSVTGIALTKLDGTAKGGIVVSICRMLNIPLAYIGIGESLEDLQDFDPAQFADALFAADS